MKKPWEHLIEGKALAPTPAIRKMAKTITDRINRVLRKWLSSKAAEHRDYQAFLDAVNKLPRDITVGSKRTRLIVFLDPNAPTVHGGMTALDSPNQTQTPPVTALRASGFEYALLVHIGIPALNTMVDDKTARRVFLGQLHTILLHEMIHIMDPKLTGDFQRQQLQYRTRKGYNLTIPDDLDAYVRTPHEQESWTRDIARNIIATVYRQTRSVEAVNQATRRPPVDNIPGTMYPNPNTPGALFNVLTIWQRSPNRWRRFLRTLRDEYEVFSQDPNGYVKHSEI